MARPGGPVPRGGSIARYRTAARRAWPIALEAWRRWDRLPPHEKERYKRMASDYARRSRETVATRRARRGGGDR